MGGNKRDPWHEAVVGHRKLGFVVSRLFAVVFLVTWPLNVDKAGGDLSHLIRTLLLLLCKSNVPMLISWHLLEKRREVCIKARSPPASLAFIAR